MIEISLNSMSHTYLTSSKYQLSPGMPSTHIVEVIKIRTKLHLRRKEKTLNSKTYPTIFSSSSGSIYIPSGNVTRFINGTFGYQEKFEDSIPIGYLTASEGYSQQPYLFVSVSSGGSNGYMYLNWIIATFRIPYKTTVP